MMVSLKTSHVLHFGPWLAGAVLGAALLAGCSSVKLNGDVPVETRTPLDANAAAGGAKGGAAGQGESHVESIDVTKGAGGAGDPSALRTIYFDFDSYVVKDE